MPRILTTAAALRCAHQGSVMLVPKGNKLRIDGSEVLLVGNLVGAIISGCTTVASTNSAPCTAVVAEIGGQAAKLSVNGRKALTDAVIATTNGISPVLTVTVATAGQTTVGSV